MSSAPARKDDVDPSPNAVSPAPAAPPSGTSRILRHDLWRWLRLARKELRETLRDRRTIVTLILMPILVYPLLSMGFRQFLLGSFSDTSRYQFRVALGSEDARAAFHHDIEIGEQFLQEDERTYKEYDPPQPKRSAKDAAADAAEPRVGRNINTLVVTDIEASVQNCSSDLAVRLRPLAVGTPDKVEAMHHRYELIYCRDSTVSRILAQFVERRLAAANQHFLQQRVGSTLVPHSWSLRSIAGQTSQAVVTLLPLVLILMTITGAVYPAIDLTAGERERGTLESLMAAPVPRLGLLFAKYVAVVTVALMTAGVNLAAMFVTSYSLGLSEFLFGEQGLSLASAGLVVVLLVLFAAFFSAVLLAVTSFARSFKEAQAYLIPLMLLAISPGFFSLMPGVEMNAALAVTPLVNIVLLARDVLLGRGEPLYAGMAVVSTILYALAAIALAARVFGSDAILYGSQGSWGDLFRRPLQPRLAPTLAGASLTAAILFALQSILGGLVATWNKDEQSLAFALVGSALVTILLYFLLPLAMAGLQFFSVPEGFQVRRAHVAAFAGAILLGLSLWPLAHELVLLSGLADQALFEHVRPQADELREMSPILLVVSVAIVPAVCEEWFFRGYFLGAVRRRMSGTSAILATAFLFALFHVFVSVVLAVRFLPSLALGVVLGWVCLRTRSVLPGMLLHATHNGLLVLMGHYQEELKQLRFGIEETQHVPPLWLVLSVVVVAAGIGLVWFSGRPEPSAAKPAELQPVPS